MTNCSPTWTPQKAASACLVILVLLCTQWTASFAQSGTNAGAASTQGASNQGEMDQVTPEREAAALTFARRHHPELAEILVPLKGMDESRYEKAIQELFKTSEQLAKLQSRIPERYETELELWKIDSRIRLLVARSAMKQDEEIHTQIKQLLIRRNEIRLAQYRTDREKLEVRITKLDATIQNLQENSESLAQKEMERLLKSVNPTRRKPGEPAAAKTDLPAATKTTPVKKTPETRKTAN